MLQAYRVTDCDWYAAHSFEQAKTLAASDMDCERDEAADPSCASGQPLAMDLVMSCTGGTQITVAESLAEMTEPGWFAGTET